MKGPRITCGGVWHKVLSLLTVGSMLLAFLPVPSYARGRHAPFTPPGTGATGPARPSVLRDVDLDAAFHLEETGADAAVRAEDWPQVAVAPPQAPDAEVRIRPNEPVPHWQAGEPVDYTPVPGPSVQGATAARATGPVLAVHPEYLNFAGQQGGLNPGSQVLGVGNAGVGTLNYALAEDIPWLSLSSTSGSVGAGERADVVVTVNTGGLLAAGSPYSGTITVDNLSDPADGEWVHVQLFVDAEAGFSTLYSYDSAGNLQRQVKPDGSVIDYEYDSLNRLTCISYPDGTSVAYGYDAVGNRTAMTDTWGTTYYTYDDFDRLTAVYFPGISPVQYEYDNAYNLTRITYPSGQVVDYGYDADNRLVSVADTSGTSGYDYDPDSGQLTTKTLPNGIYTTYGYDADGRLTDVANRQADASLISSYHYTLDGNGNRTSVVEQTPGDTKTTTYGYDELNRLEEVTYPDGRAVSYEYDPLGNRLAMTDTVNGVTRYTYDADNRLLQAGDEVFTYDANGNTIQRSSPTRTIDYTYDYENRLVRYDDGETVVEFVYDGDGNRVAKIVDGERVNYVNDVNGWLTQVLLEADADWYVDKRYTLGLDRINQADGSGDPLFYLYDSPGKSVTGLTDASGGLADIYNYDVFGGTATKTGIVDNVYTYDGEQNDPETSLIYLRRRYYDPTIGRFLTRDIFLGSQRTSQTFNPYVFVENNPVNFVDPLGLVKWWDATVAVIGIIGSSIGVVSSAAAVVVPEPATTAVGLFGLMQSSFAYQASIRRLANAIAEQDVVQPTPSGIGELVAGKPGQAFDLWSGLVLGRINPSSGMTGAISDFSSAVGAIDTTWQSVKEIWSYMPDDTPGRALEAADLAANVATFGLWDVTKRCYNYFFPPPPGGGGDFGGVALDKTADLLLNVEDIAGATYDPNTGQIVFFGQQDVTLPPMDTDDLAVAVNSVYGGQDPGVSIGTEPSEIPGQMKVRYDGQTAGTEFGWVMFESDRVLKILSLGQDNITGAPVTSSVPGYQSMLEREIESGGCTPGESSNRMWFRPKEVRLVRSADGVSMVFDAVSMEVLTESKYEGGVVGDPESEDFAAHFTAHYDDFAAEYSELEELEQLGKMVAVVKWIRDNDIPLDVSFLDNYVVNAYSTPDYTPETTVSGSSGSCTIVITGGVTYRPPNEYLADDPGDPMTGGMSSAALSQRPSETAFMWSFTVPSGLQATGLAAAQEDYTAIAQSLARSRKDGNFGLPQTDMAFPIAGDLSLHLTRYYNSFYDEPSGFGGGWAETPYQLLFPGFKQTFSFGSTLIKTLHAQITVIERPAGREDVYVLLGLDDADRALYTRSGSAELLRDNDDGTFTLTKKDETQIGFDEAGRLISITDRNSNQVVYTYSGGRLTCISQPGGRRIDLTYDGQGRVVQAAGPGGRTITYTYDGTGHLATATQVAAGQTVTYTYDADGYLIRAVDNRGNVVFDQAFDVYGRATDQTFGGTADFDLDYDLGSRQTAITDPNGNSTRRFFDSDYRLLSSTDPLSNTLAVSYAGDYGPSVITDTRGARTQYFYDVRGNVAAILDDQGRLTRFYYDGSDNLIAVQDPRGEETAFWYDDDGNMTDIYHEVTLVFDGSGNLITFSYDPTNVTTLTYDGSGNLVSVTDPEGNTRELDYDAHGVMTAITEASGLGTDLQYDALSRLTQISNDAGQSVALGYDDADNVTSIATDAGTVHYTYDGNNNLGSVTDANGNPPTQFGYDERNNLNRVTDAAGGITDYTYDVMGNLVSADLPNDTSLGYDYDELNRLVRVVHGAGDLDRDRFVYLPVVLKNAQ